jgi:hypothetical protein
MIGLLAAVHELGPGTSLRWPKPRQLSVSGVERKKAKWAENGANDLNRKLPKLSTDRLPGAGLPDNLMEIHRIKLAE